MNTLTLLRCSLGRSELVSVEIVKFLKLYFSFRKYDFENFLCTLLLPEKIKSKAFGLRAFNIELARVQDNVSDPLIGEMRLQFWSNTIDSLYKGTIPEHPVAIQLYKVIFFCLIQIKYINFIKAVLLIKIIFNNFILSVIAEPYINGMVCF